MDILNTITFMGTTESINSTTVAGTNALGNKGEAQFHHLILSEVFTACIVTSQVFPYKKHLNISVSPV